MDYPILGVGTGLTSAYIVDYYTDEEKIIMKLVYGLIVRREKVFCLLVI